MMGCEIGTTFFMDSQESWIVENKTQMILSIIFGKTYWIFFK